MLPPSNSTHDVVDPFHRKPIHHVKVWREPPRPLQPFSSNKSHLTPNIPPSYPNVVVQHSPIQKT